MTILNTFYILFTSNAKDIERDFAKARKAGKEFEGGLADANKAVSALGVSFNDLAASAVATLGSIFALGAIKNGVVDVTSFNVQMGRLAKITNVSANEISAWDAAVQRASGGPAGEFTQWLTQTNEQLIAQGNITGAKNLIPNLLELSQAWGGLTEQEKLFRAQQFGLPPDIVLLLDKGPEQVRALVEEMKKMAPITQADTDAALQLNNQWENIHRQQRQFYTYLLPTVKVINDVIRVGIAGLSGMAIAIQKIASWSGWSIIGGVVGGGLLGGTIGGAASPAAGHGVAYPSSGSDAKDAMDESRRFWLSQGYSPAQVAGLLANEQRESSFNPRAIGDNGAGVGSFQWHPDRRAAILAGTGIDVSTASHADQLRAAQFELSQGLGDQLKRTGSPEEAASLLSRQFERPANGDYEAGLRAHMAASINADFTKDMMAQAKDSLSAADTSPFSASASLAPRQTNIQIDSMVIHTQATDADGIAASINDKMKQHFRNAVGNSDDSILY